MSLRVASKIQVPRRADAASRVRVLGANAKIEFRHHDSSPFDEAVGCAMQIRLVYADRDHFWATTSVTEYSSTRVRADKGTPEIESASPSTCKRVRPVVSVLMAQRR